MTRMSLAVLVLCVVVGRLGAAQAPATPSPSSNRPQNTTPDSPRQLPDDNRPLVTALMVEVTISRYQGSKLISSVPYAVAVSPDGQGSRSRLRVGGELPIPATTFTPVPQKEGETPKPLSSFSYRSIGTNIDAWASPVGDAGRYRVGLIIEESSVYPPSEAAKNSVVVSGAPAFRSLRSENTVVLRNGQSIEYVGATDRISGETARIGVKLTVVN